jgi:peptidoglycan hydrolase-like protein with peptidoglycan-binding domain
MAQVDIEIAPPSLPIGSTSGGHDVVRLQEWLVVHGLNVGANPGIPSDQPAAAGIDGSFGSGTQAACTAFAAANGLANGTVNVAFWQAITGGMQAAFAFRSGRSAIGDAVIETAQAHLVPKPLEARRLINGRLIGQDNSGPWVRAYCLGQSVEWCQGAASQWVKQAFAALGQPLPFPLDPPQVAPLFVPSIVSSASRAGRLVLGQGGAGVVPPGSFFFVRGILDGQASHIHVGITISPVRGDGTFDTIEGNTNTDGSSNGWEVCQRVRARATCDFGLLG